MRQLKVLAVTVPVLALALVLEAAGQAVTGRPHLFDPLLLVVVFQALWGRPSDALLTGAVAGLAQDVLGSVVLGTHLLAKVIVGYSCVLVAGRLIPGQPATVVVLVAGATWLDALVLGAAGLLVGQSFTLPPVGELAVASGVNAAVGLVAFALAVRFLGLDRRTRTRRGSESR